MVIPEWIEQEIESAQLLLGSLPHDLLRSLKHVVVKECDPNFEGQGTSAKFDEWVRSLSNHDFIDFVAIILKRLP